MGKKGGRKGGVRRGFVVLLRREARVVEVKGCTNLFLCIAYTLHIHYTPMESIVHTYMTSRSGGVAFVFPK